MSIVGRPAGRPYEGMLQSNAIQKATKEREISLWRQTMKPYW
jgi:hypothetical protein